MLKFFSKQLNNKKGFTLVELIVVIAILGILIAIAVPKFSGFRDSAAEKADESTAAVLANATRIYYLQDKGGVFEEDTITLTSGTVPDYLKKYLEEESYKPQKSGGSDFAINVLADGNITVKYSGDGGKQLYPKK